MSKSAEVDRVAWSFVLVGAIIGLIASFVLSIEALALAKDPDAILACNVNLVFNCATVAKDASSALLGFPNSFIGMMAMPVLITIAVAALAGVTFPRWFIRATWAGAVAGMVFAVWMFYESYFVIQALCPWCLATDVAMVLIAYGVFRYFARSEYCSFAPKRLAEFSNKNYDLVVALSLIVLATAAIILKYGSSL